MTRPFFTGYSLALHFQNLFYFHELRHAYASLALQGGDDIKTVQENLGHATPEFTMKVYAHANQTMKKQAAERMENTIKMLSS